MSIRVQCGQCGTVMNVREDYAGTERKCPKCQGKFHVPAASTQGTPGKSLKSAGGGAITRPAPAPDGDDEEFDPIAFLTGEQPVRGASKRTGKSGGPKGPGVTEAAPEKSASGKSSPGISDDFDPMDVLGGGATGPTSKSPSGKSTTERGTVPKGKPSGAPAEKPAAAKAEEFDPMSILGAAPAPAKGPPPAAPSVAARVPGSGAAGSPPDASATPSKQPPVEKPVEKSAPPPEKGAETPPAAAEPPQPKRPSWAKAAPPPEVRDWEEPPAAPQTPEPPQPKRPSWAKAAPPPEVRDWEEPPAAPQSPEPPQPKRPSWAKPLPPAEPQDWQEPTDGAAAASPARAPAAETAPPAASPEPPRPKRPSWAKPLPGETAAAGAPGDVLEDASAAAKAAAAAMAQNVASVSADNPALQAPQPAAPLIDTAALAAAFRRRLRLIGITALTASVLFGISWMLVAPHSVSFRAIGSGHRLTLVPVVGHVTRNGEPLAGARIVFQPRGQSFRSPEAIVAEDGSYRLQFCEGRAGAPPGHYRVQLMLLGPNGRDVIPADYGEFTRQDFEVAPGGSTIDIAIETRAKQP